MALCIMILTNEQVPNFLKKKDDEYWKITKVVLFDKPKQLFEILTESYDKDNIDPKRLKKLRQKCLNHAHWNAESMSNSNKANNLMYKWVNAMVQYNKGVQGVAAFERQAGKDQARTGSNHCPFEREGGSSQQDHQEGRGVGEDFHREGKREGGVGQEDQRMQALFAEGLAID